VQPPKLLGLPHILQPFKRVLADGPEHGEPRLPATPLLLPEEALVHEGLYPVEYVHREVSLGLAHRLRGLQGASSGKDRKAREEDSLGLLSSRS
jgi:hypothetical protein